MALTINTNLASITAQRNLAYSSRRLESSVSRLSSGLRIATAADDAAGLSISERMRAQIRSLQQAQRNANDGISLANTADGALNEISAMLIRMRELAVQSLNGTSATAEQNALNTEFQGLIDEIDRVAKTTTFAGVKILDGSLVDGMDFQVGTGTGSVDRVNVSVAAATASQLLISGTDINTDGDTTRAAIIQVDGAIDKINAARSRFGAVVNRMSSTISTIAAVLQNTIATESRIRDVDIATETAEFARAQVLQQAGVAILAQANTITQSALALLRF